MKLELSLKESNELKGIALILMLIHHLFYVQTGLYDDIEINGHGLVNTIGVLCKVCVAIYVFLSGYGLGVSNPPSKQINLKKFYLRRFTKLYMNYWLIWLLFVPVGVFYFGRSFTDAYGDHNVLLRSVLDFFGLLNITGRHGYNPTWWFYSCIITLYVVFPLIASIIKRWPLTIWAILAASFLLVFAPSLLWFINPIRFYLFPFVLGIAFAKGLTYKILPPRIQEFANQAFTGNLGLTGTGLLLTALILSLLIRLRIPYAMLWDSVVALLIIISYKNLKLSEFVHESMDFVGKHSFNIFLFHTFIYAFYFTELIYWFRNPIIVFVSLISVCLVLSFLLEKTKSAVGFYKAVDKLTLKIA